jgi:hypothetical protein
MFPFKGLSKGLSKAFPMAFRAAFAKPSSSFRGPSSDFSAANCEQAVKQKNSWAPAAARSHQSDTDGSGELHRLKIVSGILAWARTATAKWLQPGCAPVAAFESDSPSGGLRHGRGMRHYRLPMASILIYDFGTNEEAAQQARHKIESWQQGLRLGKKVLFKFDRKDSANGAETGADTDSEKDSAEAKPAKKKGAGKKNKEAVESDAPASEKIRLLIRLGFSDHEKLIQQRLLDRFAAEEPFKSAQGETIRQGSTTYVESIELFDSLD